MSPNAIAISPPPRAVETTVGGRWDVAGMAASAACAVHCLAAPFLLLFLPAFGAAWSRPWVHWVLAAIVLPLAIVAIGRGYRAHRRRSTLILAGLGAAAIVAGLFLPGAGGWSFELGSIGGAASASTTAEPAAASIAGTDTCCPSVAVDAATGATTIGLPWGSTATLAGGVLLVLAHGINLHGCLCFRRSQTHANGGCGCPAHDSPCRP